MGKRFLCITVLAVLLIILAFGFAVQGNDPAKSVSESAKYMHISFDDVYLCLKDITDKEDIYTSVFENSMLADLKKLHDNYGAVFTLNCFTEANSFDIENLPDKFQAELSGNSDWLKFSFHAQDANAKYTSDDADSIISQYNKFTSAILNAAGTADSIDRVVRLGYFTGSLENVKALQNCEYGIIGILTADDDRETNYYLNSATRNRLASCNKLYDADNDVYMLKSQTRLERIETGRDRREQFAKFHEMEVDGINMLEIFTHEWAYDSIRTTLTQYVKWAYNNRYEFDYAQNIINSLKAEFFASEPENSA